PLHEVTQCKEPLRAASPQAGDGKPRSARSGGCRWCFSASMCIGVRLERSRRTATILETSSSSPEDLMQTPQHRFVQTNGIRMHVAEQGEGPLVVLCHGFPESWYSWRHQLTALAEAG